MKNILSNLQENLKQYAKNKLNFRNKNKLNLHSKVEPIQAKNPIKKIKVQANKKNDYTVAVLANIEDLVLDTILFKSNIKFTDIKYIYSFESEIRKSNCYAMLDSVSLLKYIVQSDSNVNLEPFTSHFNTLISVLESNEWLYLADDVSFVTDLTKLVKEPLNAIQNDVTYSKEELDSFQEKLVEIVNAKEKFLNKIENYLDTGTNKPDYASHVAQNNMIDVVAEFRKQNLSIRHLLQEQSNVNMKYYSTKLIKHVDNVLLNTVESFMLTEKINTSLKFQDLFSFIQRDFLSAVDKYKPINLNSSDYKQEYLGKSGFYSYLLAVAGDIQTISSVFISLDYTSNSENIIKFQQYRNGLVWVAKLLNLLKDSDVSERDLFTLIEKNFQVFTKTASSVVYNDNWTSSDWGIKDAISKWNLDVLSKNSNLKINIVSSDLINTDSPVDIAYRDTTTISFFHLLDLTIDNSIQYYLQTTLDLLEDSNYLATQEYIIWYLSNLKYFENVNKGNGLLVSKLLKTTNNYGSFELISDNDKIAKSDFNVILYTCYRLNENKYLSLNDRKLDLNVLIDYYKIYSESFDIDITTIATNHKNLIGEGV